MAGELPGGFRLAKSIDQDVSAARTPYVIPVVSNFQVRMLLICTIISIMATMYLILFGSVTGRNIKATTADNNVILCGLAQDDIAQMKMDNNPLGPQIEKACDRLMNP